MSGIGFAALAKSVEETAARQRNNNLPIRTMHWKGGEKKTFKFITPPYQTFNHDYVTCHDGKRRTFGCRKKLPDWMLKEGAQTGECLVRNAKGRHPDPSDVWMAWAVLVQEVGVPNPNGGRPTFEVKDLYETLKDGENTERRIPALYLVKQKNGNFWSLLIPAWQKFGTLLNRTYDVTRMGEGTDTKYPSMPGTELPDYKDDDSCILPYQEYFQFMESMYGLEMRLRREEYHQRNLGDKPVEGQEDDNPSVGGVDEFAVTPEQVTANLSTQFAQASTSLRDEIMGTQN